MQEDPHVIQCNSLIAQSMTMSPKHPSSTGCSVDTRQVIHEPKDDQAVVLLPSKMAHAL